MHAEYVFPVRSMSEQVREVENWIEGLDGIEVFLTIPDSASRFVEFSEQFRDFKPVRLSDRLVSAPFVHGSGNVLRQGVFRGRPTGEDIDIEFDLLTRPVGAGPAVSLIEDVVRLVAEFCSDHSARVEATAFAHMTLSTDSWRSTLSLPIALPGILGDVGGSPEVAGFEFAFQDDKSPLRRASISLFTELQEYLVRLSYTLPFLPASTLIDRAVSGVAQYSRYLVGPTSPSPLSKESQDA